MDKDNTKDKRVTVRFKDPEQFWLFKRAIATRRTTQQDYFEEQIQRLIEKTFQDEKNLEGTAIG